MKEFLQNINLEFTQVLFDSVPRLIAFLDYDFNFLFVNKEYAKADFERSKGLTKFFIGKNHFDLYPNEENKELFESVVKTGRSIYVYDKLFEYPNGKKQYFDWTLVPIKSGNIKGLVLTIAEVTERTLMEMDLKAQEFNLEQIIDNANEGILIVDHLGCIKFCNSKFSNILGISNNYELYNKSLVDYLINNKVNFKEKTFLELYQTLEKKTEVQLRNTNGEKKIAFMTIVPMKETETKKKSLFLCFFTDITEIRLYEERILNQRNELEQYSSFIAHDLRNNITKIEQYNSIITNAMDDFEGNKLLVINSLNKIGEQTRNTSYFLNRALDLAKIGKIVQKEEAIDFGRVVSAIRETLTAQYELIWKFPSRYPTILCEKSNIYHLFLNLFGNALKHSSPTAITIEFEDKHKEHDFTYFLIKISYDGVPFPKDVLEKFNNQEPLSGFGMLIIKKIIDAHKWDLEININTKNEIEYTVYNIAIPENKIVKY